MSLVERPQITLITPPVLDLDLHPKLIAQMMDKVEIACLRFAPADQDGMALIRSADALREIAHRKDIPIVIERHILLVEKLALDGVHLLDGARSLRAARKALGPDAIIGTSCGITRHDGISAAEAGADYVSFAPVGDTALGDGKRADYELFSWWSEMIEVPVVAEGALTLDLIRQFSPVTDHFALGVEIWASDDPLETLASFAKELSQA